MRFQYSSNNVGHLYRIGFDGSIGLLYLFGIGILHKSAVVFIVQWKFMDKSFIYVT